MRRCCLEVASLYEVPVLYSTVFERLVAGVPGGALETEAANR